MTKPFFYLEHVDGGYMCLRKTGKGYTWTKPETDGIPRLFKTHLGAKKALGWWVRGPITDVRGNNAASLSGKMNQMANYRSQSDWTIKEVLL